MNNIYLTGMMGCGKTTVGKLLAQRTGRKFVDIDAMIEEGEGMAVTEIFAQRGEGYFRWAEGMVLKRLAERNDLVVSCGGGIILDSQNINRMMKTGAIVYIERDIEEIIKTADAKTRPLMDDEVSFRELYEKRRPAYESACKHRVKNDAVESAVDSIIKLLEL